MEEIKVGEYVRTKQGKIRQLKSIVAQYYITDRLHINDNNQFKIEDIIKHSPNIIDLIEVGDYVNGERVIDIAQGEIKAIYTENIEQKLALIPKTNKDIKSIVTKQQMEAMEYKVGE